MAKRNKRGEEMTAEVREAEAETGRSGGERWKGEERGGERCGQN